ncbi:FecCD family ABC transporter permease [Neotabrizicola shimadae]|uniref:Iron ABC transporter permease n=1 Tax=Neotabrizicola shimadae TaxID=2807096 RepID=A0A8G0ZTN0_9RHOB|nr:iron ABC transporter permease [Neotabrizicola shimadae]QYZ68542.1 iron ABC transporter permease [Neotabrizicola shimadae]
MVDAAAPASLTRKIGTGTGIALAAAAVLLISAVVAVSVGAVAIPLSTVWGVALDRILPGVVTPDWNAGRANIVWEIRFPRVVLAGLVGAGLGLVGAALQSVTRNPLADPHLLGISSGGAFGAVAALMHTGLFLGLLTVPLMAFGGALVATVMVLGVAQLAGASSADRLVLAGVAVSFVIMACANILIFLGDPRATHTVVFWMLGGLGLAQWNHLIWPVAVLVPCGLWLWAQAGRLNAMSLGDETAASLGVEVGRFRLTVFVAAALVTGVMVAFSGLIGFVGLMMPHLVRLVVGGDNAQVLPASAFAGAVFLILADAAARVVMAPEDVPIGVVTGLIGGVFFIWMMAKRR